MIEFHGIRVGSTHICVCDPDKHGRIKMWIGTSAVTLSIEEAEQIRGLLRHAQQQGSESIEEAEEGSEIPLPYDMERAI